MRKRILSPAIYKVTNPIGQVYIGQSMFVHTRIKSYKRLDRKVIGKNIYDSLVKYGANRHSFEIIEYLPIDTKRELLLKLEVEYIAKYKNDGVLLLNMTDGGTGCKNLIISKETRKKQSIAKKGVFVGGKNGRAKTVIKYTYNGIFIEEFETITYAAISIGTTRDIIAKCCNGQREFAGGFRWDRKREYKTKFHNFPININYPYLSCLK